MAHDAGAAGRRRRRAGGAEARARHGRAGRGLLRRSPATSCTGRPASASCTAARELLDAMRPFDGRRLDDPEGHQGRDHVGERPRQVRGGHAADRRGDRLAAAVDGWTGSASTPRMPTRPTWPPTRSSGSPTYPACACSGRPPARTASASSPSRSTASTPTTCPRSWTATASPCERGTTAPRSSWSASASPATTRASVAVYNTHEEIDRLVDALLDVRRIFELD